MLQVLEHREKSYKISNIWVTFVLCYSSFFTFLGRKLERKQAVFFFLGRLNSALVYYLLLVPGIPISTTGTTARDEASRLGAKRRRSCEL